MDPEAEAESISQALRGLSASPVDPSPIIRTALPFYGVRIDDLRRITGGWFRRNPTASPRAIAALADALWSRAIREEMVVAVMILGRNRRTRAGFAAGTVRRWARLLDNWETTDSLGTGLLGPWVAEDPVGRFGVLEALAGSGSPWERRLALVGCVPLARLEQAGELWPRVSALVLRLAADREASIPKAISWVLRVNLLHCAPEVVALIDRQGRDLPAQAVRETRNKNRTGLKSGKPRP